MINRGIRQQILWMEEELSSGDLLMVVKNNYLWLGENEEQKSGFIANGDVLVVEKVFDIFDLHGCRFARARLRFPDDENEIPFEANLLLDAINEDGPAISRDKMQMLHDSIVAEHGGFPNKSEMQRVMSEDPYFNALQVKFAYCVTCHKSQGGQWPVVFLDQGWFTDDMIGEEYLRWLYTAVTRAQTELYLVNFSPECIESL
jgi:exodeoxyribonuclease V